MKIKAVGSVLFAFIAAFLPVTAVSAEDAGYKICENVDGLYSEAELKNFGCGGEPEVGAGSAVVGIIDAFIGVLAILAVIMIIIGGIWYIVSSGDPTRAKRGRDTVIFSAFGLLMALLAWAIVNFIAGAL